MAYSRNMGESGGSLNLPIPKNIGNVDARGDALLEIVLEDTTKVTSEVVPEAAPQAAPEPTYIQPLEGEDITDFFKRTGHASLEEFMQDPSNAGKIKKNAKGVPFVLEGVDYQVKTGVVTEGIQVGGGAITMTPGGTTEQGVLGKPQEIVPGDLGESVTKSEQGMVADFEVEPVVQVAEAKLDGPPVVEEEIVEVEEEFGEDLSITEITEVSAKQTAQIVKATLPEDSKVVYQDILDKIENLGFEPPKEDFYDKIAADINEKIADYNTKISDVAEEKQKPTFEGWDKFLAVLGAAMGSYGSDRKSVV